MKELFALKPTVPAELEGLAIRPMPDGSLLHILIVMDNEPSTSDTNIHVEFQHFAPAADPTCPGPSVPETPLVPGLVAVGVVAAGAVALRRSVTGRRTVRAELRG